MSGPTGEAPLSTESVGDPDAGDPGAAAQGGAATGGVLGTLVAGPLGLAVGAAAGAAAGAAGADPEDSTRSDLDGSVTRTPARSRPARQRGVVAPGPLDAHEDVPVIDASTEMTTGH